eukprot:TRINITY_DN61351_c0_g1_i3.p2 TRINITY_DN61351_c0_g1~~TRINITY_DN61351_c0_g1_i3.p2  ORF type:complete len:148 (+),score=72.71 TRINITY_DN61351_c0_g1_i3:35-445(+)
MKTMMKMNRLAVCVVALVALSLASVCVGEEESKDDEYDLVGIGIPKVFVQGGVAGLILVVCFFTSLCYCCVTRGNWEREVELKGDRSHEFDNDIDLDLAGPPDVYAGDDEYDGSSMTPQRHSVANPRKVTVQGTTD